jgi:hypothetical protein
MKFILGFLVKLVLLVLLVTLVVPVGYLAWRADQPMALPQFKGLTYYQYLAWRKDAYHQMAVAYRAAYPRVKMGGGLDMCYQTDIEVSLAIVMPMTGFYTLAGAFPNLEKYVTTEDRKDIPKNVTLLTFLPDWWLTYEKIVWYESTLAPEDAVAFCRLQPNVPTPTQLQTMLAQAAQNPKP